MPAFLEPGAQFRVVVDLAVEDEPHVASRAPAHRLMARR